MAYTAAQIKAMNARGAALLKNQGKDTKGNPIKPTANTTPTTTLGAGGSRASDYGVTPTPAKNTAPLPATNAPVSQVSSYVPAKWTATPTPTPSKSSGGGSSGSKSNKGGSNKVVGTGTPAGTLAAKMGRAPINTGGVTSGAKRTNLVTANSRLDAVKDTVGRIESAYNKALSPDRKQIYKKLTTGNKDQTYQAVMELHDSSMQRLRSQQEDAKRFAEEIATPKASAERLARGEGDNWDRFDVGASALGLGLIGGAVKTVGKGVKQGVQVVDSLNKVKKGLNIADSVNTSTTQKALDEVIRLKQQTRKAKLYNKPAQEALTEAGKKMDAAPEMAKTADNVAQQVSDAAKNYANKGANAGPYTRSADDIFRTASKAGDDAVGANLNKAKDWEKIIKRGTVGTGIVGAAGLTAYNAARTGDGATGDAVQQNMATGQTLDSIADELEGGGGVTEERLVTDGNVVGGDVAPFARTQNYSAPMSVGYNPADPTGGMGGGSGGGMSGGGFGNVGGGRNFIEATYYTYDPETGQPIPSVGYVIDGTTYIDPEGTQEIPADSLVRTVDGQGQETFWWKNEEYTAASGTGNNMIDPALWMQTMQGGAPMEEELPEEQDILSEIMAANEQYLQSEYARIDANVEQQVTALREQLAARGIYNSDVAMTMEQQLRQQGEDAKDALYGQVLSQAYGAAMDYQMGQDQLGLQRDELGLRERELEMNARDMASRLGLEYDRMGLEEQKYLRDIFESDRNYELDRYQATTSRMGAGSSGGTSDKARTAGIDAMYNAGNFALSQGATDEQIAAYVMAEASKYGMSNADAAAVLRNIANVKKSGGNYQGFYD